MYGAMNLAQSAFPLVLVSACGRDKKVTVDIIYSHGRHEDITFIAIRRFLKFISVHVSL